MAALVPESVRAIFFDAVGTLLFPEPSAIEVYRAAAARRGLLLSSDEIRSRFIAAYQAEEATDQSANWITSEPREEMRWRRIVGTTLEGRCRSRCVLSRTIRTFRPTSSVARQSGCGVRARTTARTQSGSGHRLELRFASALRARRHSRARNGSRPGGH